MELTPRAEILLKTLIGRFVVDGQPVGSKALAQYSGLEVSSATIRNVLAELEDLGLIRSPHTSAGRVPTVLGYRVFVDSLLTVQPLKADAVSQLADELGAIHDPQRLLESTSHLLSQITRLAGVVMVPRQQQLTFRQIEFLALSGNRVLVILVTQDGRVENRIVTLERGYSAAELTEAANYFNATYAGQPLDSVKRKLVSELQRDGDAVQKGVAAATDVARRAFAGGEDEAGLLVRGESNLLNVPDLGDIGKLRRLFEAFTTKRDLLHLLDRSMHAGGVSIFIGGESGYDVLQECSVVTAPYEVNGHIVGTLGVIGPTRMAYEQVIPIVDVTARLLGSALSLEGRR